MPKENRTKTNGASQEAVGSGEDEEMGGEDEMSEEDPGQEGRGAFGQGITMQQVLRFLARHAEDSGGGTGGEEGEYDEEDGGLDGGLEDAGSGTAEDGEDEDAYMDDSDDELYAPREAPTSQAEAE